MERTSENIVETENLELMLEPLLFFLLVSIMFRGNRFWKTFNKSNNNNE